MSRPFANNQTREIHPSLLWDTVFPYYWIITDTYIIFSLLFCSLKWKQLEDNPITKLLFQQCGFIPVQMTANKAGEDNDYDLASFKNLLKQSKRAFEEGFDIGILPEGQLNPNPEESLLPCFPGAFTLARMSKRPIQMMALHGTHRLWHAREDIGMTVTGREVRIRVYPNGRKYKSGDEFLATFNAVVGQFATKGFDLHKEDLQAWLDGEKWNEMKSASAEP
jgi:1-acyl-sn-glycerol-3-phosphate acyltransferase